VARDQSPPPFFLQNVFLFSPSSSYHFSFFFWRFGHSSMKGYFSILPSFQPFFRGNFSRHYDPRIPWLAWIASPLSEASLFCGSPWDSEIFFHNPPSLGGSIFPEGFSHFSCRVDHPPLDPANSCAPHVVTIFPINLGRSLSPMIGFPRSWFHQVLFFHFGTRIAGGTFLQHPFPFFTIFFPAKEMTFFL